MIAPALTNTLLPTGGSAPMAAASMLAAKINLQLIATSGKPMLLGIGGAQGSGKTTLAALLALQCQQQGLRARAVSLDDYYLSAMQRADLASRVHPLLRQRGVPGTHDVTRALADVTALRQHQPVGFPCFDKASDNVAPAKPAAQFDVIIFEGWCLGIPAQMPGSLHTAVNQLEQFQDPQLVWRNYVNQQLGGVYQQLWQQFDALVWLQAPDWPTVCRWRLQQEQQLWQQQGQGMTETELARFMLSFQRLTLHGMQQMPQLANLVIRLNPERIPQD